MAIIRSARPAEKFYFLNKEISEDESLSWAARGLLIFLLGKPDHWKVSTQHLINQTEKARVTSGRDAVRALLRELLDVGYMKRVPAHSDAGHFAGHDYLISETKEKPETDYPSSAPETDYPATAKPATEIPH